MKKIKFLTLLSFAVIFSFCSKDDDDNDVILQEQNIPTAITDYVTEYFPENEILTAIKDSSPNSVVYELYLSGNYELDFNSAYAIINIDGNYNQLPDAVIPVALLEYVQLYYSSFYITDWELEKNYQQIELNNGLTLEFQMNGTFIRVDYD